MRRLLAALVSVLSFASTCAEAQTYPARLVILIVPFTVGGPSDALARVLGQAMGTHLGQPITIENVTGAGGTLTAAKAAQARPDGYTVLLAHVGQATSATLYRKLPYNSVEAFDTIGP